jgi:Holliday junction resolvasome RuvABC endonuclease subunit
MRLPLKLIRTDGGTQARASLSKAVVDDYAMAMQQGHSFPPVVVFYDGKNNWLADGFHRVAACKQAGFEEIAVDLKLGSQREAILYAVGANADHGLRRTPADKRYAVSLMLKDREWGQWSDRAIAKATQTSHPFVAKERENLTGNVSSERVYTTKYGTQARMDTSRIGQSRTNESRVQRWLGIDPGLATLRWAVLEDSESMPRLLDYGVIQTASKRPISERLGELEKDLVALLTEFKPTAIAVEKPLFNSEYKSMEGVWEAMGVIHLVCYRETRMIPIHLFSGMWKGNIGDAKAEIEEITDTIASLFNLTVSSRERLDAIGIAYAAFCGIQVED